MYTLKVWDTMTEIQHLPKANQLCILRNLKLTDLDIELKRFEFWVKGENFGRYLCLIPYG
jgi:hypothetical protein